MGENVSFPANGGTGSGYLAVPASGSGPGIVVIQEWWGLVPHIEEMCDRFAAEGLVALAPDLYHGTTTTEPDEAGKLMMSLNLQQAATDLGGAADFLLGHEAVTSSQVGVIGYCMGGGLALVFATQRPEVVGAVAPFYGLIPWEHAQPDWSRLDAPVRGHYAEDDAFFGPEAVAELQATLDGLGKDATLIVHEGVDHAFCNDTRPEVHDEAAAAEAFADAVSFFRSSLG